MDALVEVVLVCRTPAVGDELDEEVIPRVRPWIGASLDYGNWGND